MSEGACCKVGRVREKYDLDGFDAELLDRRADGESLRALTDFTNRRVLAAALREASDDGSDAGAAPALDRVRATYDALRGDDSTEGARTRVRLRQRDVDVDAVESDFVSHPTVRDHLRECLDVDTSRSASITVTDAVDTVGWVRRQCEAVTERTVERARQAGVVDAGDVDVAVSVRVTCTDCGESFGPAALFREGGCGCAGNGPHGESAGVEQ